MNIFRKYTLRSLKKNRTRTIVTIIGIILSMAMFTAVIEAVYSGMQYLQKTVIVETGSFHSYYYGLSEKEKNAAMNDNGVKSSVYWQEIGWADINSTNEYKPYLLIKSIGDNFENSVAVKLTEGRLPQNASEIVLPNHLSENGGVDIALGETITLQVGERMSGGDVFSDKVAFSPEANEEIVNAQSRTYTVVGKMDRLDPVVEDKSCPGYTALTKGAADGPYSVFLTLKNPSKAYQYMGANNISEHYKLNSDLLMYTGVFSNSSINGTIIGFVSILSVLIAFGSISLIYNSFSISVSERTKQFGILKSIGATGRQVKTSVLFEAFVLSAIGIPFGAAAGCLGIGVTFYFLKDSFAKVLNGSENVEIKLAVTPVGLIIAAVICIITILISALIPAKRAMKTSAIEAIRQSTDIKIKAKDVKTPAFIGKIFGFPGMIAYKNFKRNKKRYRATVLSLFLSVTLFISASSFCTYLTDSVNGVAVANGVSDIDLHVYVSELDNVNDVFSALSGVKGAKDGFYVKAIQLDLTLPENKLTKDAKDSSFTTGNPDGSATVAATALFVDEASYKDFCKSSSLNADDYYNSEKPLAIAINNVNVEKGSGSAKSWGSINIFNEKNSVDGKYSRLKDVDGYVFYTEETQDNGEPIYVYFPQDYIEEYESAAKNGKTAEPDSNKALKLSKNEAYESKPLNIGAVINSDSIFGSVVGGFTLVYPYSMYETVIGPESDRNVNNAVIFFSADDHAAVCEEMTKTLKDGGYKTSYVNDMAENFETEKMIVLIVKVFSYGFIALISLIATANVFNTISTNIYLRRREFAMLKSVGLGKQSFTRMMNYECIIYGVKALIYGLPVSFAITFLIYYAVSFSYSTSFYLPMNSVIIAVVSVFAVVFLSMAYSAGRIKKDNPVETLKNENL